jgi:hypothetical protein
MSDPKVGFEMKKIRLRLTAILPVRQIKDPQKNIRRFRIIVTSIKEAGMVEPLVVHPRKGEAGSYLLLDGHLRYFALKELGETSAECIIANDDECFTYNARISRLSPIQEHKMIVKAVRNGVQPERIAAALNIPLKDVIAAMNLLEGIHQEAADLLKDKSIAPRAIRLLKKVTGVRQIEIVEMMVTTNNFTANFAEALFMGTPKDQLLHPDEPKKKEGMSPEDIARMEQEMENLEHDVKAVEGTYGENVLNLTCARGYIKKLLDNARVVRFLTANYPDFFPEFEAITAAETL